MRIFYDYPGVEESMNEYMGLLGDLYKLANGETPSRFKPKQEGEPINVDKDSVIEDVDFEVMDDKILLSE